MHFTSICTNTCWKNELHAQVKFKMAKFRFFHNYLHKTTLWIPNVTIGTPVFFIPANPLIQNSVWFSNQARKFFILWLIVTPLISMYCRRVCRPVVSRSQVQGKNTGWASMWPFLFLFLFFFLPAWPKYLNLHLHGALPELLLPGSGDKCPTCPPSSHWPGAFDRYDSKVPRLYQ